jgi:hypothetical protein
VIDLLATPSGEQWVNQIGFTLPVSDLAFCKGFVRFGPNDEPDG